MPGSLGFSDASITYSSNFYDSENRPVVSLTLGADGGLAITSSTYAGDSDLVNTTTDPLGTVTKYSYDSLGRATDDIVNWQPDAPIAPGVNVSTTTHYNAQGVVDQVQSGNVTPNHEDPDDDSSPYIFDTSTTASAYGGSVRPNGDNHWLTTVTYPDSTTEVYTYDAVGDVHHL